MFNDPNVRPTLKIVYLDASVILYSDKSEIVCLIAPSQKKHLLLSFGTRTIRSITSNGILGQEGG